MHFESIPFILILCFVLQCSTGQLSFGASDSPSPTNGDSINTRLGLLASTLGVEPVPGLSGGVAGPALGNLQEGNYGGGGGGGGIIPIDSPTPMKSNLKCTCTPRQYCNNPKRPDSGNYGVDPGLTTGKGPGGSNSGNDGSGVIDIRIVNRPPTGIVCSGDQIYCCDGGRDGQGSGQIIGSEPGSGHNNGQCGVPTIIQVPGFVEKFDEASFGEFPWLAVILGPTNNYIGAGALLDNYHVLTAAHRVAEYKQGNHMKIRFGEWNAKDDTEPYKNIEIEVSRIDIHPNFNSQNLQNDVAIIKLAQPIDITTYPHIKSVCLPKQGESFVGQRCIVAGFGKDAFKTGHHSYILRKVDLPILDGNDCEARLRQTRLGNYFELNRKSFICSGGEEGRDACTGDGGSPLVCKGYDGGFKVVGLVAWGIGCADHGIPGAYVNVPSYSSWIQNKIAYFDQRTTAVQL